MKVLGVGQRPPKWVLGWGGVGPRVTPGSALQNGKHDEAWMVLKQVHDTNMRAKGHPERVFSVSSGPPPALPPTFVQRHQSHLGTIVPKPSAPSRCHQSHLSSTSPVPVPSAPPQCHQSH